MRVEDRSPDASREPKAKISRIAVGSGTTYGSLKKPVA